MKNTTLNKALLMLGVPFALVTGLLVSFLTSYQDKLIGKTVKFKSTQIELVVVYTERVRNLDIVHCRLDLGPSASPRFHDIAVRLDELEIP